MKPIVGGFTLLALALAFFGCAEHMPVASSNAPDGFYVGTTNANQGYPYTMPVWFPGLDSPMTIHLRETREFVPQSVFVDYHHNMTGVFYVLVSGRGMEDAWSISAIFFVAHHTAYYGEESRNRSMTSVRLLLPNRKEADAVASAIRERYSLQ